MSSRHHIEFNLLPACFITLATSATALLFTPFLLLLLVHSIMTNYLEHLPLDVLRNILIFAASDTKTMLRCELVSRAFHEAVQDDKTWEFLPNVRGWKDDERFNTNRLAACARCCILVDPPRTEGDRQHSRSRIWRGAME